MSDEHWLDEELVKIAEQVDSEADLSFELDIALWLHEILKKNKIVITKEMLK